MLQLSYLPFLREVTPLSTATATTESAHSCGGLICCAPGLAWLSVLGSSFALSCSWPFHPLSLIPSTTPPFSTAIAAASFQMPANPPPPTPPPSAVHNISVTSSTSSQLFQQAAHNQEHLEHCTSSPALRRTPSTSTTVLDNFPPTPASAQAPITFNGHTYNHLPPNLVTMLAALSPISAAPSTPSVASAPLRQGVNTPSSLPPRRRHGPQPLPVSVSEFSVYYHRCLICLILCIDPPSSHGSSSYLWFSCSWFWLWLY
jgi:hypothetical protein